jgi:hypothetical protein
MKNRKEQLQQLLKIKEEKINTIPRPLSMFSTNAEMPHEKKYEFGKRILKQKILIKA